MNEAKLSSEQVPGKFMEWLLSMGCPADRVPSQEKIAEMCRGQYYMVWRSLMEKVEAQDVIREKRLQVFCDDIRRCRKNNVFSQHDSSTIVPEQLSQFKQQTDLKKQVEEAKARVMLARRDLDQLMDKVSTKLAQRSLARTRVEDLSRRVWLLRQVADDLGGKRGNLQETRTIADSLCARDDDADIQAKLDKCLSAFRKQTTSQVSLSTSNTSIASSVASNENDPEEQILQLVKNKGGDLCGALYERRSVLVQALSKCETTPRTVNKVSPQSVLAYTAALHCSLKLEATKNKLHLIHTRKKLLATITELNHYLSGEACELLVVRCEQTHYAARVHSLTTLIDEINTSSGMFYVDKEGNVPTGPVKSILTIDKDIENKKEELKMLMSAMATTERKIESARDCLQLLFAAFRADAARSQPQHYRGIQLDLPSESIPSLCSWYSLQREEHRRRVNLSMELEVSDGSITDLLDNNNPRYVDELRIYLKKFNLEKNRQLVLESGEKLWIFETIQSSMHRLYAAWCANDLSCRLLCPSQGVAVSASRIADGLRTRAELEESLGNMIPQRDVHIIDMTSQKEEEQQITDRTKKRLRENLLELQKTNKIFVLAEENLKFWTNNGIRKHISPLRKHDGMTYRDYEVYYMENCLNACT